MKQQLKQIFEKYRFIHFDQMGALSILVPLTGAQLIAKQFSGSEDAPTSLYLFGDNTCKSDLELREFFAGKRAVRNDEGIVLKPAIPSFDVSFAVLIEELTALNLDNDRTDPDKTFLKVMIQYLEQLKLEAEAFKRQNPGYPVMKNDLEVGKEHFISKGEFHVKVASDSVRNLDLPNVMTLLNSQALTTEKMIISSSVDACITALSSISLPVEENKLGLLIAEASNEMRDECTIFLNTRSTNENRATSQNASILLNDIYTKMRENHPLLPVIEDSRFDTMADQLIIFTEEWLLEDLNASVEQIFRMADLAINQLEAAPTTFSAIYDHAVKEFKEQNPEYELYINRMNSYKLFVLQTFLYLCAIQLRIKNPENAKKFLQLCQDKDKLDELVDLLSKNESLFRELMLNDFEVTSSDYTSIVQATHEIATAHIGADHFDELRVACAPLLLTNGHYPVIGGRLCWSTVPITEQSNINSKQQQKDVADEHFNVFYDNKALFVEKIELVNLIDECLKISEGNEEIVLDLIANNIELLSTHQKESFLLSAVKQKKYQCATLLIENDIFNLTAFAAAFEQIPVNNELIRSFLNANIACANYLTGAKLIQSVRDGHLEQVKIILEYKPELLEYKENFEQTAFLWACAAGQVAIAQTLMDLGADIYVRTIIPANDPQYIAHGAGKTALQWAQSLPNRIQ